MGFNHLTQLKAFRFNKSTGFVNKNFREISFRLSCLLICRQTRSEIGLLHTRSTHHGSTVFNVKLYLYFPVKQTALITRMSYITILLIHRIIELLRLEKTSKIIKSNCQPITNVPAKPCPEVPHLHIFWTPPGMGTLPLPWTAYSNAWPLFQ